jgi:hypothetical protein
LTGRPRNEVLRFLTAGVADPMKVPLVVLGLAIDESADGKTYLVCGVLASVGAWDDLALEWNRILSIHPAVPYWHQSEVYARRPDSPFSALTAEQVYDREVLLADALGSISPRIISTTMSAAHYAAAKSAWFGEVRQLRRRERKQWLSKNHQYSVLHSAWPEQLHREPEAFAGDEKAIVIFEQSDSTRRDAETYRFIVGANRYYVERGRADRIHLVVPAPGKRPDTRPLEAADMAAWVSRRHLSRAQPHHLFDRVLGQALSERYIELEQDAVRAYFGVMAEVERLEGEQERESKRP